MVPNCVNRQWNYIASSCKQMKSNRIWRKLERRRETKLVNLLYPSSCKIRSIDQVLIIRNRHRLVLCLWTEKKMEDGDYEESGDLWHFRRLLKFGKGAQNLWRTYNNQPWSSVIEILAVKFWEVCCNSFFWGGEIKIGGVNLLPFLLRCCGIPTFVRFNASIL